VLELEANEIYYICEISRAKYKPSNEDMD